MKRTMKRSLSVLCRTALILSLAACSAPGTSDAIQSGQVTLGTYPETFTAPSGDRSVIYGGTTEARLTFSAGYMKRIDLGLVTPGSGLSWAPDSRSFYVNETSDPTSSELRLWRVGGPQGVRDTPAVRQAAIHDLAARNGCQSPAAGEYATQALGWAQEGKVVLVWTRVHHVQACPPEVRQPEGFSLIEIQDGTVLQAVNREEAALRWPELALPSPPVASNPAP